MLRKEIKELAQRMLKGKYGTWAPFAVLPALVIMFAVFIGIFSMGFLSRAVSDYDSRYYSQYDESRTDEDYSDEYDDEYDDDYSDEYDEYEDYDEYDDYDEYEDYYSFYTPAYNYGYSLGTQAGYLKGWEDGLAGVGDGYQREKDKDIINSVKEKPVEFLYSEEFEEGLLDAYSFSYSEAWNDSKEYKKEVKNLSANT